MNRELGEPASSLLTLGRVLAGESGILEWIGVRAALSLEGLDLVGRTRLLREGGALDGAVALDVERVLAQADPAWWKGLGRGPTQDEADVALRIVVGTIVWLFTTWAKGPKCAVEALFPPPTAIVQVNDPGLRRIVAPPLALPGGSIWMPRDGVAQHLERAAPGQTDPDGDPLGLVIAHEHGPFLKRILVDEVTHTLAATNIFSHDKLVQCVEKVTKDESFQRVAGPSDVSLLHPVELDRGMSHRLGLVTDVPRIKGAIGQRGPLRIAVAPAQAGVAAILTYMKRVMGYDVELGFEFAHSPEMARRIVEGRLPSPPDACVLGSAATATVLAHGGRLQYTALMMMPRISHRVVAPAGGDRGGYAGHYVAISSSPSTTQFYYEKLVREGRIATHGRVEHFDPDETTQLLADGDPELRAMMWFPAYRFNQEWNGCELIDAEDGHGGDQATFLFVRNELMAAPEFAASLSLAIRNAWSTLRASPRMVSLTVDEMLRDGRYVNLLMRVTGAYNIVGDGRRGTVAAQPSVPAVVAAPPVDSKGGGPYWTKEEAAREVKRHGVKPTNPDALIRRLKDDGLLPKGEAVRRVRRSVIQQYIGTQLTEHLWKCRRCKGRNPLNVAECDECGVPRGED